MTSSDTVSGQSGQASGGAGSGSVADSGHSGQLARRRERTWRAVLRRPLAAVSVGYLLLLLVAAIAADVIAPYGPATLDLTSVLSTPTADHWLGTDPLGRDVLTRLIYGGRISLLNAAMAAVTFLVIGVSSGLAAGFLGGWTDRAFTWMVDLIIAIPGLIVLLVVLTVFGSNMVIAMVTLGVLTAPGLARVVRGVTLAVRQELYIAAARVSGLPNMRIVVRHVLPRVMGPILVQVSLFCGAALLIDAGLAYLGFGVQPPTPTWGGMIVEASRVIQQQPWLLVPPGAMLALATFAFALLGDVIRDVSAERTGRAPIRAARRRRRRKVHNTVPSGSGTVEPTVGGSTTSVPSIGAGTTGGQDQQTGATGNATAVADRDTMSGQGQATTEKTSTTVDAPPSVLLSLRDVSVALPMSGGLTRVVEGVSLDVHPGETVGLVGESGCGKSITGSAILGLLPSGGQVLSGSIGFEGTDVSVADPRAMRRLRGSQIALISQEPVASLDPVYTAGQQLSELIRRHHGGSSRAVRDRMLQLLADVRLPEPQRVARRYPHELSGGMAQRVAIAMALAGEPRLLIADEPTTALDVTVQAEILALLRGLQADRDMAILLISHDWGVIAQTCQRAYVMYAGHVVESCVVADMFNQPLHPYTVGLLGSTPRRAQPGEHLAAIAGAVPTPGAWPSGCHFAPRCPMATPECSQAPIPLFEPDPHHHTRCLHYPKLRTGGDR